MSGQTQEGGTVLVLGAGASFAARRGTPHPPPLGAGLARYLLDWLKENDPQRTEQRRSAALEDDETAPHRSLWENYDELRLCLEKAVDQADGFERAMADLAEQSELGLLASLNAVIAVSLLGGEGCAFIEEPDLYDELVDALGSRLRAVITPNYDILFEEALSRREVAFRYGGIASEPAPVTVFKIHGSANFFLPNGGGLGATVELAQSHVKPSHVVDQVHFMSVFNDHRIYVPPDRMNALYEHAGRVMTPILVTYAPQKPALYALPHLIKVREECASDLKGNPPARILATGIRPPFEDASGADDPPWSALCELFEELPSSKEYWSRDPVERESMTRFGFDGRDGWFDALVQAVEKEG